MEFQLLIFGTLWLKYFIPHQTKPTNPKVKKYFGTCRGTPHSTGKTKIQPSTSISIWAMFMTLGGRIFAQKLSRGHIIWNVMRKSALKDFVNWRIKRQSSYTKFPLIAWTTITSRRRSWKRFKDCQKYALKLSWKCLYLTRIGGPDILWAVNKFALAVARWTQACDKRLARLTSYIHHTNDCRMWQTLGSFDSLHSSHEWI